jgi:hypothetical protein
MLKRKVTVCCSIFSLMLMLGWRLDQLIQEKRFSTFIMPSSNDGYNIRSTNFNEPVDINMPFLPREYVRIIRRISE